MATPVRKLILDDIESTLKSIGSLANAKTAPCKVERVAKDWDSAGNEERPWVGFRVNRSTHVHRPFGFIEVRMLVDIIGHVNGDDADSRAENINDLMDDIVAALHVDTRRGGNAIHTTVQQTETDEGDPDSVDSGGGGGSLAMLVEVFYERTVNIS